MTIVCGDACLINYDTIERMWIGESLVCLKDDNGAINTKIVPALMVSIHGEENFLLASENREHIVECFRRIKNAVVHGDSYCELTKIDGVLYSYFSGVKVGVPPSVS